MIVTFLAVLEMMRRGMMLAYQEKDFADIYCEAA
jgi:chromatin segregation and condensation protein Rec8/ScpA/Scc1 (kleisin family)